jgi:hypothetical protein
MWSEVAIDWDWVCSPGPIPDDKLFIHVLAAWGIDEHGAALVIFVFPVQLLQKFIQHLQDIGGQHVAESSQIVWDFFIVIHIYVSV